ncbi:hypothetical protein [Methylibium sp.]|uniref:hypothetical protein n=1 Tax=Methylibium sp. TaxID=2067992 RepID=UPI003D0E0A29
MAEAVDITWDTAGRFEHTVSVAPGKPVEVCGKLPARVKVRWDYRAAAPLDFNVHYHVGKSIVFPAKRSAAVVAQGRLDTKVEQDYCWMWTNKAAEPAALTVRLARGQS